MSNSGQNEQRDELEKLAADAGFVPTAMHPTVVPMVAGWWCDRDSLRRLIRAAAGVREQGLAPLERPACFEFAMDFLGDPEEPIVREYVERLEQQVALLRGASEIRTPSSDA